MDRKKILSQMKLEDKVAFCSGADYWHTKAYPQYGIPESMMSDGPHGLRVQPKSSDMLGINESVPATCFPPAVTTACSWDQELLTKIGRAIGEEAASFGVGMVLGPGVNIKRNPLCGRNFEYFSEDPVLAGRLGGAHIRGVESTGVSACLKHMACNNQEYKRFSSDSIINVRTLREIYLTPFEIAVKEGRPSAVMSAYNRINGVHCSDNDLLLSQVLRREWGFRGMVTSDWGGMHNRILAFRAGCDLMMPGGSAYMEKEAVRSVRRGVLKEKFVDRSVMRILGIVNKSQKAVKSAAPVDWQAHYELARRAAEEGAVLMKNEDGMLPLAEEEAESILFVGFMARKMRYQGGGSSHINPKKKTEILDSCPGVMYAQGCREDGTTDAALLDELRQKAAKAKKVVVFAGLPESYESEGFDRNNMKMPEGMNEMIAAAVAACPDTAVVLMSGGVVEIPWADQVKAILYLGLPGEAGGEAVADLLFGRVSPSGKLAETWPVRYRDCICSSYYAHGRRNAEYREGLYVGYRYYATAEVPVLYAFGHGLSYTTFEYSDLDIEGSCVTFRVTNTGSCPGAEVVQLYVEPPKDDYCRPVLSLQAFRRVELAPGESQMVTFILGYRSFAIWDAGLRRFAEPEGVYKIRVGGASDDLPLCGTICRENRIKTEAPVPRKLPAWYRNLKGVPSHREFERLIGHEIRQRAQTRGTFTMDSTLQELSRSSYAAKFVYYLVRKKLLKEYGGNEKDPNYQLSLAAAADSSLFTMRINGQMKNYAVEALLDIANRHYIEGIGKLFRRA